MRRPPASPKERAVRRCFEPHRLAPEYLAAAYEQVMPFAGRQRGAAPGSAPPRAAGGKLPRKEAA
jgi:hypothetical protein